MWIPINQQLPPENVLVLTKISDHRGDRNEQKLKRQGRLYFATDSMYVYYEPTHWYKEF